MKIFKNWNIKMTKCLVYKALKASNRNDNENCRPQNTN